MCDKQTNALGHNKNHARERGLSEQKKNGGKVG